jgi:hypothetical protein
MFEPPQFFNPYGEVNVSGAHFPHWEHFANCVRYIRRNPEKAKLGAAEFTHDESELARELMG